MEPNLLSMHLVRAVGVGETQAVLDALSYGAVPKDLVYQDQPLLHHALAKDYNVIAKALVQHGCDPNAYNPSGKTVLHYLSMVDKVDMLNFILESGGNLDVNDKQHGNRPLHFAALHNKLENIKVLLKHNVTIECYNNLQESPLHSAASKGHTDVCSYLLSIGVKIDHRNTDGFTALHFSCRGGHLHTVNFLLNNGAKFYRTHHGETDLMLATKQQSVDIVKVLIDFGSDLNCCNTKKQTALHYSAKLQDPEICKLLLQNRASLDMCDSRGWTPAMVATKEGSTIVLQTLIAHGCNLEEQDEHGFSALHIAAYNGNVEVAQLLLKSGVSCTTTSARCNLPHMIASERGHADVLRCILTSKRAHKHHFINSVNKSLKTALHMAVNHDHYKCVQVLLQEGADMERVGVKGNTPLMLAAWRGHSAIQRLLLEYTDSHCSINRLNTERRTALHLAAASGSAKCTEQLLNSGALLDLRDWHGETPLLLAAEQGCEAVVALLIKEGCDIRAVNDSGWNALHLAIKKRHCHVAHRLIAAGLSTDIPVSSINLTPLSIASIRTDYPTMKLLIRKGCDVNLADENGWLPLHRVARTGHTHCAKLLIVNGAIIDLETRGGDTPANVAVKFGHRHMLKLLLENNAKVQKINMFDIKPGSKFRSILEMLLLAGYRISPGTIEHHFQLQELPLSLIEDTELYDKVLTWMRNPNSLKQSCRLSIRSLFGYSIKKKMDKLQNIVPSVIMKYLLFKDLPDVIVNN